MASVVLLKGINVGGHRNVRPTALARQLKHLGAVNIGAAGTFVIRKAVGRAQLRAEFVGRLPFEADVLICDGRDILRLAAGDPFAGEPSRPEIIWFVSVLAKRPATVLTIPSHLPNDTDWCVRVLARQNRFILGVYRREMRTIGYLGQLEKICGVPAATRNWNTILSIVRVLKGAAP